MTDCRARRSVSHPIKHQSEQKGFVLYLFAFSSIVARTHTHFHKVQFGGHHLILFSFLQECFRELCRSMYSFFSCWNIRFRLNQHHSLRTTMHFGWSPVQRWPHCVSKLSSLKWMSKYLFNVGTLQLWSISSYVVSHSKRIEIILMKRYGESRNSRFLRRVHTSVGTLTLWSQAGVLFSPISTRARSLTHACDPPCWCDCAGVHWVSQLM